MFTGLILDAAEFEVLVGGERVARRPLADADVRLLQDVAVRYVHAVQTRAEDPVFLGLGRELFAWIDGGQGGWSGLLQRATAPLVFEVQTPGPPSPAGWAALRAPWEVLADEVGFLAADGLRRFEVVRRLGKPSQASPLDGFRLGLMFMASAPAGQQELDFEAEESAILTAVGDSRVDLVVEDTGDPDQLSLRWADLDGLPVLHLSCHGVNNWPSNGTRVPVLMMEDEVGEPRPVTAAELVGRLSVMPRLMFVSACLTATAADASGHLPPGPAHRASDSPGNGNGNGVMVPVAHSLSTELVSAGVPAVVGWDGSVTDGAATLFAQHLYQRLGLRQELAAAVGDARRKLLACKDPQLRADWHLARIWLGPTGGGRVVAGTARRQVSAVQATKTFLDLKQQHVPVATADMFVGRRREMRTALRALRGGERAGVLLHGQGRLGKSSLAARLADRFPDRAVAVVFGDYTAMGVLEAVAAAVQDNPAARTLIESRRAEVRDHPEVLRWVLIDLLAGPLTQAGEHRQRPLLLIIDDLEQILVAQADGPHRLATGYAPVLAAALQAFDPSLGDSRLVLTSRFVFALDGLEDRLASVQLTPLSDVAQLKLAVRQRAVSPEDLREARADLAARAVAVSRGNPGLQDLVALRLVYSSQVAPARAEQAVSDMETYLSQGDLPASSEVRAFVENLAIDALIEQAGPAHIALLRALTLFDLPIPTTVIGLLETRTGGSVQRLCGLGLADTFPDARDQATTAVAVNALAAGRLTPLTAVEQTELAALMVQPLLAAWGGPGQQSEWSRGLDLQLTMLAVQADDPAVVALCAPDAVQGLLAGPAQVALRLGQQALAILDRHAIPARVLLLRRVAEAALISGDGDIAATLSGRAVEQATAGGVAADPLEHARAIAEHARLLKDRGEPEQAEMLLHQARDIFTAEGSEREAAFAWGDIASLLYWRGEFDEALRIRHEVELPVYERLGDTRAIAFTWGDIADIMYQRGELDEALRIRHEVELPVYERLGNTRSIAFTWGKIADIMYQRSQYDDSLRIRYERQLPVYERLGDTREIAIVWGKIADIMHRRSEYDEALRIYREKQLPVYERLGDTREIAIAWGKIAVILHRQGDIDAALRIHQEKALPAFEKVGDTRSLAITWGNIASIHYQNGDYGEAQRINQEKALPAFEQLGDTRSIAVAWSNIASIHHENGNYEEAQRINQEKALPALEQLGDLDGIANIRWRIAEIQLDQNDFSAAASNLVAAFQIFDHLDRPDGLAVTGGILGQLLIASGEPDAARQVLEKSLAAARKVVNRRLAEQIQELLRGVESRPDGG